MSKKLLAALSVSLFLAACNTTADLTVDDETTTDDETVTDDAMMDESSSSSVDNGTGAEIDVEADSTIEISE